MNKAFTLIELLAVIIILAVVALIATPIILNVIEDSKKSANKSQIELLLNGAENYYAQGLLNDKNFNENENIYFFIETTNEKPENGTIKINNNGEIYLSIYLEGICYSKNFNQNIINENKTDDKENCSPKQELVENVYNYTGDFQTFVAPQDGMYKFEAWGASFDFTSKGAYTKGEVYLNKDQVIYIYVGQQGYSVSNATTFNGGTGSSEGYPGGGATDFRLVSGEWNDTNSLVSRIMVAAGEGSGIENGAGGGLYGYSGNDVVTYGAVKGGSQILPGVVEHHTYLESGFGYSNGGCTGGGGYYGAGAASCAYGAGGGSSFISGHTGSVAIKSATEIIPKSTTFNTRYIEIGSNGNKLGIGNEIVEIEAYDTNNNNVALNKPITSNRDIYNGYEFPKSNDGIIADHNYGIVGSTTTIDLQQSYDIDTIKIWRFYVDNRYYRDTYIKLYNEDKTQYTYVQNHETDGIYIEKSDGYIFTPCSTGNNIKECSIHYSNISFENTVMIDGLGYSWSNLKNKQVNMPNIDGSTKNIGIGNNGHGIAKISYIKN